MSIIILDDHKDLFKDEASFHQLVSIFRTALDQNSMPMVLSTKELLFTAISPDMTKEILAERILKGFWENPERLNQATQHWYTDSTHKRAISACA